jgi:hypothetical protein
MSKKVKRIIIEIITFILISIIVIFIYNILDDKFYNMRISTIFNVIVTMIFGMFINAIHTEIAIKRIKFNLLNFIVFIFCVVLMILLWTLYSILPKFVTNNFLTIYYLISLYAGANLFSSFFKQSNN